jgi:hypothetical protein
MIDPNFTDPAQQERLQKQKMEAMKVIMSELIDNPTGVEVDEMKKVIDYLDTKPSVNNEDE